MSTTSTTLSTTAPALVRDDLVPLEQEYDLYLAIDSSTLQAALKQVGHVVPGKPAQPILACLLLTATPAGLRLTATDLQVWVDRLVPATVAVTGSLAVPAKLLADMVDDLPAGTPVTLAIAADQTTLQVTTSTIALTIAGLPADDVTAPRPVTGMAPYGTMDRAAFCTAIAQVAPAVSTTHTNPQLHGISLAVGEDGALTLVALDGFCLAVRQRPLTTVGDHTPAITVPGTALREAVRCLAADDDPELTLTLDPAATQLRLATAGLAVTLRLIDGSFPDWPRFVPAPSVETREAILQTADLARALKLFKGVAPTNNVVRLDLQPATADTPAQLTLQATNDERATAKLALPVDLVHGDALTVAFNLSYLREALEVTPSPTIIFTGTTSDAPGVWRPTEDLGTALYLVMPMRFTGGAA